MAKQFTITRDARGKLTDNSADKEFDNVAQQLETKFNGILNKLNSFDLRGTSENRKIDISEGTNEADLSKIVNLFSTLVEDLKKYLSS